MYLSFFFFALYKLFILTILLFIYYILEENGYGDLYSAHTEL